MNNTQEKSKYVQNMHKYFDRQIWNPFQQAGQGTNDNNWLK